MTLPAADPGLKKSPIDPLHRRAGARMAPFAGWELPQYFRGILEEHRAVRERVGIFDVSHLGRVVVEGVGAAAALAGVLTLSPPKLGVKSGRYCLSLNEGGGISDDLIVFRLAEERFLLVPNAVNVSRIARAAGRGGAGSGVGRPRKAELPSVDDITARTALFALQGPRSDEVLAAVGVTVQGERYAVLDASVAGCETTVFRSGYTGERGVEVMCGEGDAEWVWTALLSAGEEFGIARCGLGARDTLRLEMCYPLWGQDIDDSTGPVEAGLMFAVDMENKSFMGRGAVEATLGAEPQRRLVPLEMVAGIARRADPLFAGGERVGAVTSGTFSPTLRRGIALGYVGAAFSSPGQRLAAEVRGKRRNAVVVKKPFYRGTG